MPHSRQLTPPLCVDLDGTLIAGDTLMLSVTGLMGRQPWGLLPAGLALVTRGRAAFKDAVARRFRLEVTGLPWRAELIEFLRSQRAAGRRLVLATAAHHEIAAAVARHLPLFDGVIASDANNNLKGERKVAAVRAYTEGGEFDYAGDSWADLPVFAAARRSILVTDDLRLVAKAREIGRVEVVFGA